MVVAVVHLACPPTTIPTEWEKERMLREREGSSEGVRIDGLSHRISDTAREESLGGKRVGLVRFPVTLSDDLRCSSSGTLPR
ncbi:hypothetical protein L2E82_19905 [Cichorium intybus]|uniref:Uncharacterized protein n=1 Tax=Cichorium intybus TaxID=13427 RepID=A0ACB9DSL1_CICIN|nr:hypothetical protein L2E82_19905 [Cichorium intybus]